MSGYNNDQSTEVPMNESGIDFLEMAYTKDSNENPRLDASEQSED